MKQFKEPCFTVQLKGTGETGRLLIVTETNTEVVMMAGVKEIARIDSQIEYMKRSILDILAEKIIRTNPEKHVN